MRDSEHWFAGTEYRSDVILTDSILSKVWWGANHRLIWVRDAQSMAIIEFVYPGQGDDSPVSRGAYEQRGPRQNRAMGSSSLLFRMASGI